MDKTQEVKDILTLHKDPEMAIYKGIKAVKEGVDKVQESVSNLKFPDPTPATDLGELNEKIDKVIEKQNEEISVEIEIV